jgi:hypothetical protein
VGKGEIVSLGLLSAPQLFLVELLGAVEAVEVGVLALVGIAGTVVMVGIGGIILEPMVLLGLVEAEEAEEVEALSKIIQTPEIL